MTAAPAPPPLAGPLPPWADEDIDQLDALLAAVPAPWAPLDAAMLDGYLVGVLLQPRAVPPERWWPWVLDSEDGRAPPRGWDSAPLWVAVQRRHNELQRAIRARQWFDPWVFELDDEAASLADTLLPWVAGFALATDVCPALLDSDDPRLLEPLAVIFQHLDPDDLEDAEALLMAIEDTEPPVDLPQAVEHLVSAVLMLADVTQPLRRTPARTPSQARPRARPGPAPRRPSRR